MARILDVVVLFIFLVCLIGCGDSGTPTTQVAAVPAPIISSISPASAAEGHAELVVTITGSGFTSGSVAHWNGAPKTTTVVSGTEISVTILASDLAVGGMTKLYVLNPGSGPSNSVDFAVNHPEPTLTGVSSAGAEVLLTGSGFCPSTTGTYAGQPRPTKFLSAEKLEMTLTEGDVATAAIADIGVATPSPGGGSSGPLPFTSISRGTSGAVSSLVLGSKQYLFIPLPSDQYKDPTTGNWIPLEAILVVVDITVPETPTVVRTWPAAALGGEGTRVLAISGGPAGHPQLLLFKMAHEGETTDSYLAILNALTLVTGTPGVDSPVDFSAVLPMTLPVVWYPEHRHLDFTYRAQLMTAVLWPGEGFWLATSDGYRWFELATYGLGTLYPPPYVGVLGPATWPVVAENMAGDSATGMLLAGFAARGTDFGTTYGVELLDVGNGARYLLDGSANAICGVADFFIRTNAIDPQLQLGALTTNESIIMMDLGGITYPTPTTFAPGANGCVTFSTGTSGADVMQLTPVPAYSRSVIDPTTHLMLLTHYNYANVAVAQLKDAPLTPGWMPVTDWRYQTAYDWSNPSQDSPTIIYNVIAGRPFGYFYKPPSYAPWAVHQLDMQAFLAMTPSGATGDAAHIPAADSVASGIVRKIY